MSVGGPGRAGLPSASAQREQADAFGLEEGSREGWGRLAQKRQDEEVGLEPRLEWEEEEYPSLSFLLALL